MSDYIKFLSFNLLCLLFFHYLKHVFFSALLKKAFSLVWLLKHGCYSNKLSVELYGYYISKEILSGFQCP